MSEISLAEQLECVDRELSMRSRVYPRWVSERKLTQALADKEMARMRAVRSTLAGLAPLIEEDDDAA